VELVSVSVWSGIEGWTSAARVNASTCLHQRVCLQKEGGLGACCCLALCHVVACCVGVNQYDGQDQEQCASLCCSMLSESCMWVGTWQQQCKVWGANAVYVC
jgi:hypothetical protein